MAVVRKMTVTFEKRDWGSGRATWREYHPHKRLGPSHLTTRRISNRKAKHRETSGDVLQVY